MDETLADFAVGQRAVVTGVAGERMARMKLMDMGLVPGTLVTIKHMAPLGDPVEMTVRGSVLTLRKDEAALVTAAAAPAGCHEEAMPTDASAAEALAPACILCSAGCARKGGAQK